MREMRRAIAQARFQRGPSVWLVFEFIVASVFVWLVTDSATIAVAVLFALVVSCVIPYLSFLVVICFSVLWSLVFIELGLEVGGLPGAIVIGGFGALMSFGLHFAGLAGFQDSVV
ncbi:hypothetical protein [Maritalea sp.]|uniref:hypothetical protein n=1 Tax=Maritalea sp. TaxID=2003361 RepID=UPI003EF521B5